jgi:hypothetical protein
MRQHQKIMKTLFMISKSRNFYRVKILAFILFTAQLYGVKAQCPVALNQTYNTDLIINSSCTLPVNGTYIFDPGIKIIVQTGATLTVSQGVTLNSSSLISAWAGIVVQAGATVELQTDAAIKNAEIGVMVESGGTLKATEAKFINNRIGAYFNPGSNQDNYFRKCNFEWNDNYYSSLFMSFGQMLIGSDYQNEKEEFFQHVFLNDIDDVKFYGNVFTNKRSYLLWGTDASGTTQFKWKARGVAIASHNSSFLVNNDAPCYYKYDPTPPPRDPNCVPCHGAQNIFSGLYTGIVLLGNDNYNDHADIKGARFIDNGWGVRRPTRYFDPLLISSDPISHILLQTDVFITTPAVVRNIFVADCKFELTASLVPNHTGNKVLTKGGAVCLRKCSDVTVFNNIVVFDIAPSMTSGMCLDNQSAAYHMEENGFGVIYLEDCDGPGSKKIIRNAIEMNIEEEMACNYPGGNNCVIFEGMNENVDFTCNRFFMNNYLLFAPGNLYADILFLNNSQAAYSPSAMGSSVSGAFNRFSAEWTGYTPNPSSPQFDKFDIAFSSTALTNAMDWQNGSSHQKINYFFGTNPSPLLVPDKIFNNPGNVNLEAFPASSNTMCGDMAFCGSYLQQNTIPDETGGPVAPGGGMPSGPAINAFQASPNPTAGIVVLTWDFGTPHIIDENGNPVGGGGAIASGGTLYLLDAFGNLITGFPPMVFTGITGNLTFDLSNYPPGVYYIRVITDTGFVYTIMIIKL